MGDVIAEHNSKDYNSMLSINLWVSQAIATYDRWRSVKGQQMRNLQQEAFLTPRWVSQI